MNNETKDEVKKNVVTGASTVAGATAGVVIGAAITPDSAVAAEIETPEITSQTAQAPKPVSQPISQSEPELAKPEPITPEPITPEPHQTDEVEVVGYDRVANKDGSRMDIAMLNAESNGVGVIDANLDGEADALICDLNQNGVIDEGEIEIVQDQGIAMQPFADAAGFNSQFAQNELPDYVNDADVDTYMA